MSIDLNIQESLRNYVYHRLEPGSFVRSILENDLRTAVRSAHPLNVASIPDIVAWLDDYAPMLCWGNPRKVEVWLKNRGGVT
jgi:hypothetical protein